MSYRGISLLSVPYKAFCSILNSRLTAWLEEESVIHEAQNGFRKEWSYLEHIFVISNLVDTRKRMGLDTFVCFVDFQKAYDRVNRAYLWQKLISVGVQEKFVQMIKAMYSGTSSCVRVNGKLTDWFGVNIGVRQGCVMSPALFNIYVNDLVDDLEDSNVGVPILQEQVTCLLYADDLSLLAESEPELQVLIKVVERWCVTWKMALNVDKTAVIHFRPKRKKRSIFEFRFQGDVVQIVDKYKYLGVWFTEHVDWKTTDKSMAEAASKAVCTLIARSRACGGLRYETFSRLFESCVLPTMCYGGGVWGMYECKCVSDVWFRACRYYLGVGRLHPKAAIEGDMGWIPIRCKLVLEALTLWFHLTCAPNSRLCKRVYMWGRRMFEECRIPNWCSKIKECLEECGLGSLWQ